MTKNGDFVPPTVCLGFSLVLNTELNTWYMLNIPAERDPVPALDGGAGGVAGHGGVQSSQSQACRDRAVAQPGRDDSCPGVCREAPGENYLWTFPRSRRVCQVFAVEFDCSGWTGRTVKLPS